MRKVALIVGVEEYRDQMISRLKFARADAIALADYLRTRCKFDDVRLLADNEGPNVPELGNTIDALREICSELRPEGLFLFFFAGHGVEVDGHGYLLVRDSRQAFPEHGSLSLSLLEKTFSRLAASKRILLLDACRNSPEAARGDTDNLMSNGLCRDIVAAARAKTTGGATTVLFSACKAGQRAREWPEKCHGVFTHFLLEGINGAAWQGDQLEFEDLASYTHREVVRWCSSTPGISEPQIPWYEKFGIPDSIVLAIGQQLRPAVATESVPQRERLLTECAICGKRNDQMDTFQCPKCRRNLCLRHLDEKVNVCIDCSTKITPTLSQSMKSKTPTADSGIGELRDLIRHDAEECTRLDKESDRLDDDNRSKRLWEQMEKLANTRIIQWRRAAELGWPEGQYLLGFCCENGFAGESDTAEAVRWYLRAAEQNYAAAQHCLGVCYQMGDGVDEDLTEAAKWFQEAAKQGDADAQFDLALSYSHGDGVAKDEAEAARWYRAAAKHGHARAQYKLGECYAEGKGVSRDEDEAMRWIRKAAEHGDDLAKKVLKELKDPCFISTAVAESLGWSDDCSELNLLRELRDGYMQQTIGRQAEVQTYYWIAPRIVGRTRASDNPGMVWQEMAKRFVLPVVKLAKAGDAPGAHRLYKQMIEELTDKWLTLNERAAVSANIQISDDPKAFLRTS